MGEEGVVEMFGSFLSSTECFCRQIHELAK